MDKVDVYHTPVKNLQMQGANFKNSNMVFGIDDPQNVYKQDLRDTNLEGVEILPSAKFDGVHIEGAKFSTSKDARKIGINKEAFRGAIYDRNTTLDGVPLTSLLSEKEHSSKK